MKNSFTVQSNKIKICTEYEVNGKRSKNLSSFLNELEKVIPIYKSVEGWNCSTVGIKSFDELPSNAKDYILYLEKILDIPIKHISTGPKRNDIIIR